MVLVNISIVLCSQEYSSSKKVVITFDIFLAAKLSLGDLLRDCRRSRYNGSIGEIIFD